jgi:hypothetical protein
MASSYRQMLIFDICALCSMTRTTVFIKGQRCAESNGPNRAVSETYRLAICLTTIPTSTLTGGWADKWQLPVYWNVESKYTYQS